MEINYPKTLVIQNSKGDATFYFAEFDIEEDMAEYIIVAEKKDLELWIPLLLRMQDRRPILQNLYP